eukprot:gene17199-biopygen11514
MKLCYGLRAQCIARGLRGNPYRRVGMCKGCRSLQRITPPPLEENPAARRAIVHGSAPAQSEKKNAPMPPLRMPPLRSVAAAGPTMQPPHILITMPPSHVLITADDSGAVRRYSTPTAPEVGGDHT